MSTEENRSVVSRLGNAVKIVRKQGIGGFATAVRNYLAEVASFRARDYRWQGRIVELLGNRARVEGMQLDLHFPEIETPLKGRFFKGTYERPERVLLRKYFTYANPVIELGASIGVLACITNKRLKTPDRHLIVEANPRLIPILERHRALNNGQFQIVHGALAYDSDIVTFHLHPAFNGGSVQMTTGEAVQVPARSLQSLAESQSFATFDLICDIEGGEVDLVAREGHYLAEHVDWLLIEMHPFMLGEGPVAATTALLEQHGFQLMEEIEGSYCYRNRAFAAGNESFS